MELNYFAFGSNLSSARLLERIPSAVKHCVATLDRHQLRWHKCGRDRSGKCDIHFTGNRRDCVHGVIYMMTHEQKLVLDGYEGEGIGYQRREISVVSQAGETIEAFSYFALQINHGLQPYHWYKEHVLRGAVEHGLPIDYVDIIRATASIDDHDQERHQRELSIYAESP